MTQSRAFDRSSDAAVDVREAKRAAQPLDAGVAADELAQTGAVDKRHGLEIEQDMLTSAFNQAADGVLQIATALGERNAARHDQNRIAPLLTFFDVSGHVDSRTVRTD